MNNDYQGRAAYITAYPPPPKPESMSSSATVMHIIMCFLTVGLWIPVWIVHATVFNKAQLERLKELNAYWNHVNELFPEG